jgi:RNA polymerase sigma-70 factor (ECF subfamily)
MTGTLIVDAALSDDKQLIARMLEGEERAFSAFFDNYFPRLYRFALPRLSGDVDGAREVVQATLIKAIRNLASYRGEAALFTWICQICRRQIVDHLRSQRKHDRNVVLVDDSPEMRAIFESLEASEQSDPSHSYGETETRQLIQGVLDRLPARYGDVLEWKYIEGRTVEEIGALLGIGPIAAQSILARARTSFRQALETVFGAETADVLAAMRSGG